MHVSWRCAKRNLGIELLELRGKACGHAERSDGRRHIGGGGEVWFSDLMGVKVNLRLGCLIVVLGTASTRERVHVQMKQRRKARCP